MALHQVDTTDSRDVRRYIAVPFRLYRDHPLWVPPFVGEVRGRLDRTRDAFYEHSDAAFFLATEGSDVVGRIAVLDNAQHNSFRDERTAFFWHFDVIEDHQVAGQLFDAAFDWARRHGLDTLWGPRGFTALDGKGVLVDGFEHRPAMGVGYNYPYYPGLLEKLGFEKDVDLVSFHMDRTFELPERVLRVARKVKERSGFRTAPIETKAQLRGMVPRVAAAYNSAFSELKGFVPVTEGEAKAIGDRILTVGDPTMVKVLVKGEEVVGFVIAYPDLSAAIQRCGGRIWPTGWIHLKREFRRTSWINFNGMAILGKHRGLGGNAILYAELHDTLIGRTQYQHADLVQVQDVNDKMLRELSLLGLEPYKRHRVYRQSLA
jgi:GNAT superfamily N-acetyltransferase